MPQSVDANRLLAEIETELTALEAACKATEAAVLAGNFDEASELLSEQRRLTHALENAVYSAKSVRTKTHDVAIFQRVGAVGAARDRQIEYLKKYQADITARLKTVNQWKRAAKSLLSGFTRERGIGRLDQMR